MNAFLNWLRDLPVLFLFLLFITAFSASALAGYAIFKKTLLKYITINDEANHGVSFFGATILSFFGIAVGLIIVASWQNYTQAKNIIEEEGSALAAVYNDSRSIPEPYGGNIRKDLKQYAKEVLVTDWPAHKNDTYSERSSAILDLLQVDITRAAGEPKLNEAIINQIFNQYNKVVQQRRLRINAVLFGIPGVLWLALFVSSILSNVIFYCYFIADKRLKYFLLVLLGVFTGTVFFVLFSLDNPYHGAVQVKPEIFQSLLSTWN